jgi:hypothetical protein
MKDTQLEKKLTLQKRLVLAALFLSLIVLMENTANLYGYISNLKDFQKTMAMYFMGISAEVAIFICIYCGSQTAGFVFALLSFLVGMTFHNWNQPVFFYSANDWTNFQFIPTKHFFASLLLQLINSSIVLYLSILHVKIENLLSMNDQLRIMKEAVTAVERRRNDLERQCDDLTRKANDITSLIDGGNLKLVDIQKEGYRTLNELKDKEQAIERRIEDLKRQALSLQNSNNKKSSILKVKEV